MSEMCLFDRFQAAAVTFRRLSRWYHGSDDALRDRLMDAANDVFLARDACAALVGGDVFQQEILDMDVDNVRDFLRENDIPMSGVPLRTQTGRTTYRVLTPSRSM